MDKAFCTGDGSIYTTANFVSQPLDDFERKRRLLQCPECHGPAFFRNTSLNGRAACFGARPHGAGCSLAAYDLVRLHNGGADEQDSSLMPGSKIIVDFGYGSPAQFGQVDATKTAPDWYSRDGYLPEAPVHRRLSSLLRTLIDVPAFSTSDQRILIDGHDEVAVMDFFVPLLSATPQHSGLFRGYWGLLSDARLAEDHSVWFNSGGNDNISFLLDKRFLDDFNQRYRFEGPEDLSGAYILVFGKPRVTQNGKLWCLIDDPCFMAIRFT